MTTVRIIQIVALLLALAWAGTIWWVNGIPGSDLPRISWVNNIPHFDKIVHFGMYAILGAFAWGATALGTPAGSRQWYGWSGMTILLPAIFGAFDEWRQGSVPGRSASMADWYADAAGAIVAVVLLMVIHLAWTKWRERKEIAGSEQPELEPAI
jgi:hypothetical protein